MKKLLLTLLVALIGLTTNAQSDYYIALPASNATSQVRGPQGLYRYQRSVWIITAAEMAASGFTSGNLLNSLGFNYTTGLDVATTGNIQIYLQNTADATNLKSTTWTTAISTMTSVSNGSVTLPTAIGEFDIPFTGSPFNYTGGGIYVAFDYQNPTPGVLPTVASTLTANNLLAAGTKSANSATAAPATLGANSTFRPETIFGKVVTCARPTNLGFNTPTLTSANLTFNVTSGGTVNLEYGPYNFTPGSGTTISNITSPYNLTGLTPSTAYEYYLKKDCGAGNLSAYQGPFPFYSTFQPTNATYNTGFEIEDFPFLGWLATPNNTANSWFLNFGGTGSTLVQNGQYSAIAITPTATAAAERMFSRGINLTAGSTTTITYYVRNLQQTASTNLASYQLTVGSDQTAATQTTVIATETGLSNTTFALKTFTFTPPTTGTYYFSFLHNSPANATGTHALIVDNFTVSEVLSRRDFLFSKIAIFPNPTTGIVNIKNEANLLIESIDISDINGRTIKVVSPKNISNIEVNISDLTSGVYFMNIKTNEGSTIKKIVKQ
ncbi:T9SS type A sorting domain-containing protein [Flavobacterium sp.]|uniref:T9SS type A sorting domain-containing protein n=1 Tax=Flavobacterium sp. TaxID=239 RepID=UPI0038FC7753